MNAGWLLSSSFIWGALVASAGLSTLLLWLSPDGIGALRHRKSDLQRSQEALSQVVRKNREIAEEVQRLAARDPELFETLARRQGYARPGESIYTFKDRGESR